MFNQMKIPGVQFLKLDCQHRFNVNVRMENLNNIILDIKKN